MLTPLSPSWAVSPCFPMAKPRAPCCMKVRVWSKVQSMLLELMSSMTLMLQLRSEEINPREKRM